MRFFKFLFIFSIISCQPSSSLFGLDVKSCYIKDQAKHESNLSLFKTILDQELAQISNFAPSDQAAHLSSRVRQIANALMMNGFSTEAYGVPELDQDSIVSFKYFILWEGEKNFSGMIPLTFFVYVWPSEKIALKYNSTDPENRYYASIIHSHPIPCALAVLQGSLVQNTYEEVSSKDKYIRLINEEIFKEGEGEVDDLKKPFIHKVYNRGDHTDISMSLHVYGLPSSEKVRACFRETYSTCSYEGHLLLEE